MTHSTGLLERLRLYLVLDPDHLSADPMVVAAAAIRGGVTAVQLRTKGKTDRTTFALALELRELTVSHGAMFIVNDRLDLALASSADGVHLGVDDLPVGAARSLAGQEFVIGFSPETDDQAAQAANLGADYLGVGPVYETTTKSDAGVAVGIKTVAERARLSGLPTIGVGGITAATARAVIEGGACGVAVVSAIAGSDDPESAARRFRVAIDQ